MKTLHSVTTNQGDFDICQERPGAGLVWVRRIGATTERSSGAFYSNMGNGWHPDPLVACMQGIRRKCSKVRSLLRKKVNGE